ncbi:MAG: DUF3261 domain-containing protein [Planctomycetes bacterium]|nr:DUF3261 domain-containing protein [Planctomycetota bacterium]
MNCTTIRRLGSWLPWLLAACAAPRRQLVDGDYPGRLQPPAALGVDLVWQQRITATWGEGEQRGFEAALQKQRDELTVIGMSPLGQVGFVLIQRPAGVTFENRTDMQLPFPPRFVLLDVQRTFFPWLPADPTLRDGDRQAVVDDELVTERYRDGRLRERTFTRCSGQPAGVIQVTYDWDAAQPQQRAPRQAVLNNGWFRYRLTIDTHAETVLPPAGS